ncbi:MAG: tetratricopeptide repeat protein [Candidatus Kariarchaeaceae archaeon]|jgi:tetratricopeptide (TPR) repeat protein
MTFNAIAKYIKEFIIKPKVAPKIVELDSVEQDILDGNLDEAMAKINNYKKENTFTKYGEFADYYQTANSILTSKVHNLKGEYETAQDLASKAKEISIEKEYRVLISSSNLAIATSLLETGKINESMDIIDEGEIQVTSLKRHYKTEYKSDLATLKYIKSKILRRKGDLDEAVTYLNECIAIRDEIGNLNETAEPLNDLGIIYARRGDTDNALLYLNQSLDRFKLTQNEAQMLKLYNNIGMIYQMRSETEIALDNYQNALELSKKSGNKRNISSITLNIGALFKELGDLGKATDHFEQSKVMFEEMDNKQYLAIVLNQLGGIHAIKGEVDQALEKYTQSLELSKAIDDKVEIGVSYNNIGITHQSKGEYQEAINYIQQAIEVFESVDENNPSIGSSFTSIIQSSLHLNNIELAEEYLMKYDEYQQRLDSKNINQMYRLSKALILQKSDRVVKRAEAQQIFQEIAEEKIINQETTTDAMIQLSYLLLQELKISASEAVLSEFRTMIDKLFNISSNIDTAAIDQYPTRINVILLRAKMALIDLDVEHAQGLLSEAHEMAESKGLTQFADQAAAEQEALKNEMMKYKQMVDSSASLYERLNEAKIENYLSKVGEMLKR